MKVILALLLTVILSGVVDEQSGSGDRESGDRSSLKASGGFVALSVPDAEASARWYEQSLGLRIALRPLDTPDFKVIVLEGRRWTVELVQRRDARPLSVVAPQITSRDQIHGIFKAGVLVNQLDKTIEFLRARNVPIAFGPYPAHDGQAANLIIRDGDGNLIQFIEKE